MTFTTQIELFKWVWTTRPHFSEQSGEPLGWEMNAYFFAHVLGKGAYPAFKFSPFNIVLLTIEEHRLFDHGSVKDRPEWQWLLEYKQNLIRKYYEQQRNRISFRGGKM